MAPQLRWLVRRRCPRCGAPWVDAGAGSLGPICVVCDGSLQGRDFLGQAVLAGCERKRRPHSHRAGVPLRIAGRRPRPAVSSRDVSVHVPGAWQRPRAGTSHPSRRRLRLQTQGGPARSARMPAKPKPPTHRLAMLGAGSARSARPGGPSPNGDGQVPSSGSCRARWGVAILAWSRRVVPQMRDSRHAGARLGTFVPLQPFTFPVRQHGLQVGAGQEQVTISLSHSVDVHRSYLLCSSTFLRHVRSLTSWRRRSATLPASFRSRPAMSDSWSSTASLRCCPMVSRTPDCRFRSGCASGWFGAG
jgi:hypothetical protein